MPILMKLLFFQWPSTRRSDGRNLITNDSMNCVHTAGTPVDRNSENVSLFFYWYSTVIGTVLQYLVL